MACNFKYWMNGRPVSTGDTGSLKYWMNGAPWVIHIATTTPPAAPLKYIFVMAEI